MPGRTPRDPASSPVLGAALLAICLILAACTGGSRDSGDNITLVGGSDSGGNSPDPVVSEVPIAYIQRPLPAQPDDLRDPLAFNPGARLLMRSQATSRVPEVDLTERIGAIVAADEGVDAADIQLDIKDLTVAFDGELLVFAVRGVAEPVDANLELSTWNLWQYDFSSDRLEYLIDSPINRDGNNDRHDIAPAFLPDDTIVFTSTRQTGVRGRQLDEGRIQYPGQDEDENLPAAVLHRLDPDTQQIEQLSFNQSHDLFPTVLEDGRIVFSRWDNAVGNDRLSLYALNPSGRRHSLLYGYHSHDTGNGFAEIQFARPRQMADGRLMTLVRPWNSSSYGGNILLLDTAGFTEHDQPNWGNRGAGGSGQTPLTPMLVRTDGLPSPGGLFSTAWPLHDGTNRVLVGWSDCRAVDNGLFRPCTIAPPNAPAAPPLYGLWIYDPQQNIQRPIVPGTEGLMFSDVIAAESRQFPSAPNESDILETSLTGEGLLRIDSVYDVDGTDVSPAGITNHRLPDSGPYFSRPARFLRIVVPVPIPEDDVRDVPNYAYGVSRQQFMREILGYFPIEPDGSVTARVPAERPFMLSIVDADLRRLGPDGQGVGERHDVWLQIGEGEILRCAGCHTASSELPHGRLDAQPPSSNPGAATIDENGLIFIGFARTRFDLFGTSEGQTMAEVFDLRRPSGNASEATRPIWLGRADPLEPLAYTDEWTDTFFYTPDADIDLRYDTAWPVAEVPIADSAGALPDRIVINYPYHVQPIWERFRQSIANLGLVDGGGNPIETCVDCHSTGGDTEVPPGQLDLSAQASDITAQHYRSYRELLSGDSEQWITDGGQLADRVQTCPVDEFGNPIFNGTTPQAMDGNGNPLFTTVPFFVAPVMSISGANNSGAFFRCFEGGSCGRYSPGTTGSRCTDTGGTPHVPGNFDHTGLLSESELRLLSEWLDIGGQYYNNPFHPDLN